MNNHLQILIYPLSGDCNESNAANDLKKTIENSISPETNGIIYILSGVNIPIGRVSDIDILLIGNLQNCQIQTDQQETIEVCSFCTTIELKEQTVDNVYVTGTDVYVNYPTSNEKKNASNQNRNQKYTLLNYCKSHNYHIFTTNILWLKSVSREVWNNNEWNSASAILLSQFTFKDIINQIIKSGQKPINGKLIATDKNTSNNVIKQLVNDLTQTRPIAPEVLRAKTELLVSETLKKETKQIIDTKELVCVNGKAGTGKTFLLLQTALKRAEEGYSCALLTYNNALTMDLRRLVSFIKSTPDARNNLTISTLHSYIYSLLSFLKLNHQKDLSSAQKYVRSLKEQNGNNPLKTRYNDDLDDFIFVDEAQDCSPTEKDILEDVYGQERIIVAKSALQKIRRNTSAKWGTPKIQLIYGLRQKANIVRFLHELASAMGISDTCAGVEPIQGLEGGKIIIAPNYKTDLHSRLENTCKEAGCSNYDILILVPPSQVENKHFKNASKWINEAKINIIDGTNTNALESCKPNELINSCRIFQYESCRGLEGWATVCYNLDEILDIKIKEMKQESNYINECNRSKIEQAYQWIMMPLTRAIDTLVITISNTNSDIVDKLKKASEKCSDFVEYTID